MAYVKKNIFTLEASGIVEDQMNFCNRKNKIVVGVKRGLGIAPLIGEQHLKKPGIRRVHLKESCTIGVC